MKYLAIVKDKRGKVKLVDVEAESREDAREKIRACKIFQSECVKGAIEVLGILTPKEFGNLLYFTLSRLEEEGLIGYDSATGKWYLKSR